MTKSTKELLIGAGVVVVGGFAVYELFIKPKAAAPAGTTAAVTVSIPQAPTPPVSSK